MISNFTIIKKDKKTRARLGLLKTLHGIVKTPSYVMVGTYGQIRNLSPKDIKATKTKIIIANTYHLWDWALQRAPLQSKGALCRRLGLKIPTMTDSGGFQVFSLAFGHNQGVKKIFPNQPAKARKLERKNIKVTEKGVYFLLDGRKRFLGPQLSIKIQEKLGADIIFAFDELTYLLDNYQYTKESLERTHRWAEICLRVKKRKDQLIFGITQGGPFKNLRVKGAKFIGSLPFDGFGIGGSFGKKEMVDVLKWTIPYLPDEKPRHLLGVGQIDDIFRAIENGVDLFDCVIPTREARHGRLYTKTGHIDIRKGKYISDTKVIEKGCGCPTCTTKGTFVNEGAPCSRSEIRKLIKSKDRKLNAAGQRWCMMHNMWFFNNLVEDIRSSIAKGEFKEFKKKFLTKFIT